MSTTLSERWVYPPNWDGNAPEKGGWRKVTKQFTSIIDDSSGTEETKAAKIDISELRTTLGNEPTRTVIEDIKYSQTGFDSIKLGWDRAAEETICVLGDHSGEFDYKKEGGLADPGEEGDRTGDIVLTTVGAADGATYDITVGLRLKDK